ncbi:MAG: hypothetical protein ABSD03_15995 [Vulcanimicrobiaceae bacterium]|jgi:phage major head subunit gpT-like protein
MAVTTRDRASAIGADANRGERVREVGRARGNSFKKLNARGLAEMRKEIKERYRIDPERVVEESFDERFSFKEFAKNYAKAAGGSRRLSEAQSASANSQVLRYGITKLAGEGYELEPSVFENEIAEVVPSKGFENYYAPYFRPGRGGPVERGEAYNAVKMSGLNVAIRNYKFGSILEIEEELIEDDQTGQIIQQGTQIGESLSYEVDMFGFAQMIAANWSATGNQNTGGGALLTPIVNTAHAKLRKIRDTNGNLIVINPDTLLVDSDEELAGAQILESIGTANNPGTTPAAGSLIYFGTVNPLRGRYKLVATPWLSESQRSASNTNGYGLDNATPPKFLLRAKRRIILQTRKPLQVIQEAPNSGDSFRTDTLSFKGRMRFGAGVVDTRYAFQIN